MRAPRPSPLVLSILAAAGASAFAPPDQANFFAVEAVTADAQRFVAEWARPGAHVDLTSDSHFTRGASATVFVIFRGCRPDAKGACDVEARFSLVRPDGRAEPPVPAVLWRRPPLGRGVFMRAVAAPTFTFEKSDPPGVYRMKAEVTDRVSGATLTMTTPLTYG